MTVQVAYNQWAKTYDTDANLTRDLDAVVTKDALENLRSQKIVEIGCGTGKNTRLLTQIAESVTALDFSQEMLAKAKAKITAPNVQFAQADLTQAWPSLDQSVDLVVCNLVLEHIDDLDHVFSEASRSLVANGRFFISELHPFKQNLGSQANFRHGNENTRIEAFVHNISDFLKAASENGMQLVDLGEWWHEDDQDQPPRLITFMFEKL
jgi:ubiquinone/menaquinone biosynthesis C-methylase UbiE